MPLRLTAAQRDRLRDLLEDPDTWVLRHAWDDYLLDGRTGTVVDPATLTRDHLAASIAWLEQQRHPLYRALEGRDRAPDGWLEALPLYRRLEELLGHGTHRRHAPSVSARAPR
ncbi:MAG: hypothetical protein ACLFV0_11480 [Nitriliruptoraceae bacterium]